MFRFNAYLSHLLYLVLRLFIFLLESLAALEESRSRKSTNRGKGSTKGSSKKKVREEPNPSKHVSAFA